MSGVTAIGWTDPFSYDPLSYRRVLASKTAVNWHVKVKGIEYNVGLMN